MTGREAFKIWAPAGARWVDWVRPVPFAAGNEVPPAHAAERFTVPAVFYIDEPWQNTALVIDTPGHSSVEEGVALAKMGFRPIPLFNGTNGQAGTMALVDTLSLATALRWGASELAATAIPPDAPPVFLLDCNRTHRYKMNAAVFDNSWDLYDQDMPSAAYLLNNGIERVVVRGESIQKDVGRILYAYQSNGIAVLFTKGYDPPQAVVVRKPPRKRG